MIENNQFLNQLAGDLYQRASRLPPTFELPIRIIDSPDIANRIFNSPEAFIKNYSFLEKFSRGRFSANDQDWAKRAKLTQHFYHQSTHLLSDSQIYDVYLSNLRKLQRKQISCIWDCAIYSAIEVISASYGLKAPMPWPLDLIKAVLRELAKEQVEAWLNPQDVSQISNHHLKKIRQEISRLWSHDDDLNNFLEAMSRAAGESDHEFAIGELLQNLLAATETTASAFCWIVYSLGRYQDSQATLRLINKDKEQEFFIDEVLRLYPPVPFVTRKLANNVSIDGIHFQQGEHILISIVGLHCHQDFWGKPMQFQYPRAEFVSNSFNPLAYRPFISGPRVCGGMRLAKRELIMGLKALLSSHTIESITADPLVSYGLTMKPGIALDGYLAER